MQDSVAATFSIQEHELKNSKHREIFLIIQSLCLLGPIYIYNLQEGFRSLAVLEGLGHLFDLLGRSFQSGQSLRGVPALPERLVLPKSQGHPGTVTPKNIVSHMR